MTLSSSNLDSQLKTLEEKSTDELLDIIGAFALSQTPEALRSSLAINRTITAETIKKAAKKLLLEIEPTVKEAICGQDGIAALLEKPTVQDVLAVLLPILGYSAGAVVPTAIIAVSFILLRVGLRDYCRKGFSIQEEI